MRIDIVDQPIGILAELKEVALFLYLFYRPPAVRAFAIYQLMLRPKRFAGRAVPSLVFAFVNIALVIELLENLLYGFFMALFRSPDKIIILNIHQRPQLLDVCYNPIHKCLGRLPRLLGFALNLLAMLVRTCQKHYVIASQALKARHRICGHCTIAMPNMQIVRWIIDRRCNVKFPFLAHRLQCLLLLSSIPYCLTKMMRLSCTSGKAGTVSRCMQYATSCSIPRA